VNFFWQKAAFFPLFESETLANRPEGFLHPKDLLEDGYEPKLFQFTESMPEEGTEFPPALPKRR